MRSLKSIFLELVREAKKKDQQQKVYVKKNPFNMDPELNKPYGVPSSGLPQKSVHTKDGTYSTSGSGYSTTGVSGLSRANKEFDLPTDKDKPMKFKKRIGEDNGVDLRIKLARKRK